MFLAVGGALAGIIRAELATPGLQLVDESTYNSVFTIHGSVMVYLFAVPFGFALANYLVPLQIGAARPGVPAAQRAVVLAVPVRRADDAARLLHQRRGGVVRLVRLPAAVRADRARRGSAATCGSSPSS